jgi:hypothetical protein
LKASSFLPAAQSMFVLAERFRNVSLTLKRFQGSYTRNGNLRIG